MLVLDLAASPIMNLGNYENLVGLILGILIAGVADFVLFVILKRVVARAYIIVAEAFILASWLFNIYFLLIVSCLAFLTGVVLFFLANVNETRYLIANNLVGKSVPSLFRKKAQKGESLFDREAVYSKVRDAVIWMSKQKQGAIITFEKKDSIAEFAKSGTPVNAPVSTELLQTIFYVGTRLHDGAVVIKDDKIIFASVYYTPSTRPMEGKFGSRHRAAIGISEICDAVTLVVSEETGRISFAVGGELTTVKPDEVLPKLMELMSATSPVEEKEE